MSKATTPVVNAPRKRLAIDRTIIPLSWNPTDPLGYAKWKEDVQYENYSYLLDDVIDGVHQILAEC